MTRTISDMMDDPTIENWKLDLSEHQALLPHVMKMSLGQVLLRLSVQIMTLP